MNKIKLLKRLERIQEAMHPRDEKEPVTKLDVEKARSRDIYDLHTWEKMKGKPEKFMALCPFHDEKSPSFSVRGNKFNCFGCGVKGSVIDFKMKLDGLNFVNAVKALM